MDRFPRSAQIRWHFKAASGLKKQNPTKTEKREAEDIALKSGEDIAVCLGTDSNQRLLILRPEEKRGKRKTPRDWEKERTRSSPFPSLPSPFAHSSSICSQQPSHGHGGSELCSFFPPNHSPGIVFRHTRCYYTCCHQHCRDLSTCFDCLKICERSGLDPKNEHLGFLPCCFSFDFPLWFFRRWTKMPLGDLNPLLSKYGSAISIFSPPLLLTILRSSFEMLRAWTVSTNVLYRT